MRQSSKRRALAAAGALALFIGVWLALRSESPPENEVEAVGAAEVEAGTQRGHLDRPGRVSAVTGNPIKRALSNTSWQIVARGKAGVPASEDPAAAPKPNSDSTDVPFGTRAKLSLEFVRANFNAAGMRGVRQFAAFSPPQFEAIKKSLGRRKDTEISAAPDEFTGAGETIGFDLSNAADGREFSIDLTPKIAPDGRAIRLQTISRATERRRDGTLPIWDGQTVMIPLGDAPGKRQIAAFITVRLTDPHGKPINDFVVSK